MKKLTLLFPLLSVLCSFPAISAELPANGTEYKDQTSILKLLSRSYEQLKDPSCLKAALSEELVTELDKGATLKSATFSYLGEQDHKPYEVGVIFTLKYADKPGFVFYRNTGKRCKLTVCDSLIPAELCKQE